jgi:hypothetical protein
MSLTLEFSIKDCVGVAVLTGRREGDGLPTLTHTLHTINQPRDNNRQKNCSYFTGKKNRDSEKLIYSQIK